MLQVTLGLQLVSRVMVSSQHLQSHYYAFYSISQVNFILLSYIRPTVLFQYTNYQIELFMHKYVYHRSKLPPALWTYFDENKLIHQYNSRQKMIFTCTLLTVKVEKGQ